MVIYFLFFSYYNSWLRKASFATSVALWKKGVDTVRSPLFNQDLTSGIMAALADPGTKGQIFEAMGPQFFVHVLLALLSKKTPQNRPKDCPKIVHKE